MTWVKLNVDVPRDPRLLAAGPQARFLWIAGTCYCGENLTDGHIPASALGLIGGTKAQARKLVEQGLWEPVEDGWREVGYLDRQRSRAQVEKDKADAAERQARWRKAREEKARKKAGARNAVTHAEPTSVDTDPDPSPLGREGSGHEPATHDPRANLPHLRAVKAQLHDQAPAAS